MELLNGLTDRNLRFPQYQLQPKSIRDGSVMVKPLL